MHTDPHATRPDGSGVLIWLQRLLLAGGAAALLWCAYVFADAWWTQRLAREALAESAAIETSRAPVTTPSEELPSATAPDWPSLPTTAPPPESRTVPAKPEPSRRETRAPRPGAPLAELSIPRVHLSAMVLHGSDEHTLRVGVGHIEHTAWPGEAGNVAIAGHRDSFFRPLREVKIGDEIFLNTGRRVFLYRVTLVEVVTPDNLSVLRPTAEPTLTLITCFPFTLIGHAPDRFVVQASRVDDALVP